MFAQGRPLMRAKRSCRSVPSAVVGGTDGGLRRRDEPQAPAEYGDARLSPRRRRRSPVHSETVRSLLASCPQVEANGWQLRVGGVDHQRGVCGSVAMGRVAGGPVVGWALVRSPLASPDGVPDAADGSAAFADRDVGCDPHLSRRCRAERKAHSLPGDDVLPRLRRCDQDGRSEWSDAEHGQQHAPDQTQEPHRVRSKRRAHGGASILRGSGALACQ